MRRTTALWRAFLGLGDVASTKGRYLEDREEGLEMSFGFENFLVPGVWIGAGAAAGGKVVPRVPLKSRVLMREGPK